LGGSDSDAVACYGPATDSKQGAKIFTGMLWWQRHRNGGTQRAVVATAETSQPADFGRYRLERRIGAGAVGKVYLARDVGTGASVAVKTLNLDRNLPESERLDAGDRFRREAQLLEGLNHPGIARFLDTGVADGVAWIAMELIVGTDLTRYTRPARLLPEPLVAHVGARAAEALAYAHARGVIHRDVKPANILVNLTRDVVKLTDFGIARLGEHSQTRTGVTLGSPEYMAPEQLSGAEVGPPADIYALGATLFELLSGRRPHQAETLGELLRAAATESPAQLSALRPELPGAMCELVMQALSRQPAQRPVASSWAERLAVWARVSPGPAVAPT
jgi:eukaryotic-like serine/threonine-protein kinase